MRTSNNTVLITGGASGIGLALAKRFVNAGSTVIACGRREAKLREAKEIDGRIQTLVADVSTGVGRAALVQSALKDFPALNVLVNNAGIQRRIRLEDQEPWDVTREELATNLDAPIHLTRLLLPHLMTKRPGAILNITSGLAFAPLARTPVYSATKAALHSSSDIHAERQGWPTSPTDRPGQSFIGHDDSHIARAVGRGTDVVSG